MADGNLNRPAVHQRFKAVIDSLYQDGEQTTPSAESAALEETASCPVLPAVTCPIYTQSLQA